MNNCIQKHLGARNELIACTWLLNEGYEVFRNISQHGEVDLIAMRSGQITFFDVKAASYRTDNKASTYGNRLKQSQLQAGVKRLNVYPDGACAIVDELTTLEEARAQRLCLHCGEPFKPTRDIHVLCSVKCRNQHNEDKRRGDGPRRTYTKRKR